MRRKIEFIGIHCTAGSQKQTIASIRAYWKSLGWKTDGYHVIIPPNGKEEWLVPIEKPSNGVKGFNSVLINISYIGGVEIIRRRNSKGQPVDTLGKPIDNRTPEQKATMLRLVTELNEKFPQAIIQGHRDFSPDKNRDGIIQPSEWMKTCPSFSVKQWLSDVGFKSATPIVLKTTTASVNLREGQGTKFKVITVVPAGTQVKEISQVKDWSFCKVGDRKGWIKSSYLA